MKTMKGRLVTLEPLDIEKHGPGYFEMSQDENIHRYVGNTVPRSLEEVTALLQAYEAHFLNWIILSNETQQVIGILRLGKPEREDGVLVAGESQRLHSAYWRRGHMKEAKKLFYQYVFDDLSVEILYADVWAGNVNSMRSLEYYGYRLVETTHEVFSKTGELTRRYFYRLRKDDYFRSAAKRT